MQKRSRYGACNSKLGMEYVIENQQLVLIHSL
jgi:hypothetical protein